MEFTQTTRTSQEAADTVGCSVGEIAKSLVFMGKHSQKPILVIASGSNRVDEKKIAGYTGEPVKKPDADFVREKTGFVIGGVPPVGHTGTLETYIDEDLFKYQQIWAAAGSPNAVFPLTPAELVQMTGGRIVPTKKD